MEALRPGATQESELHATSREGETRTSGSPQSPDTRVTPTSARRDIDADSDLLDASSEGNMAAVKRILEAGWLDVNSRGGDSLTPVMRAALRGHREVVELLVSEGADVSLGNVYGDNILHLACRGGHMETVKFLLSLNVVDINSRGWRSRTPVMETAVGEHRDVVELLVSEGADVSLGNVYGDNILHLACRGGHMETVKFLLSLNVVDINSRGWRSRTPVMETAVGEHREMVELLVSEGADVSLGNVYGDNILHLACRGGHIDTVKFVLSLNVVDINSRGWRSRRPMMKAALKGHREVVELLVSEGADVSLVNVFGDNILHLACRGGHMKTVKFVLSLNVVDINSREWRSRTPVMRATVVGHREVVELLVSEGADVSLMDNDGNNTFHLACAGGDVGTVKFVLSLNVVDIDARNNIGQTAGDRARLSRYQKIVKLLEPPRCHVM